MHIIDNVLMIRTDIADTEFDDLWGISSKI